LPHRRQAPAGGFRCIGIGLSTRFSPHHRSRRNLTSCCFQFRLPPRGHAAAEARFDGTASVDRLYRLVAVATLAIGIFVAVSSLVMVVTCWSPLPLVDSWDVLVSGRAITWSWLVSFHNEHRMLFPRLVFVADYWLAAETNVVDFAVGGLTLAGTALLVLGMSRESERRWPAAAWRAGLTLGALMLGGAVRGADLGLPFVEFWGALLAATAAFYVFGAAAATLANLALAAVCGAAAAYTMASGVIVPFVSVVLAFWLRRPRRHLALLSLAAILTFGSYLIGYAGANRPHQSLSTLAHPLSDLAYAAAYLGGPFGEAAGSLFRLNPLVACIVVGMRAF